MFTLTVYRGDRIVQELDLDGPEVRIGRNAENQVVLADDGKGVSRLHAIIRSEDGGYLLIDNHSQNGTYVDGKRVKQAVLVHGQDFAIGPYRLVLGSGERTGSDQEGVLPVTVVAPRAATPPPVPVAPVASAHESSRSRPASQTHSKPTVVSPGPRRDTADPRGALKSLSPAVLYGAGGLAVVVLAASIGWVFWSASTPQAPLIALNDPTTTTSSTTTTSVPETPVDPHADAIAQAELQVAAAEEAFNAKRFPAAISQYERVLTEILSVTSAAPDHARAQELDKLVRTRISEARSLDAASKPKPTIAKDYGPTAVRRRDNESDGDYERRNDAAHRDYNYGKRMYDEGNYATARQVFEDILDKVGEWRDVSTYVRNSENAIESARQRALDAGNKQELEGFEALKNRRYPESVSAYLGAKKSFEEAAGLSAPAAAKLLSDNLARRRQAALEIISRARSYANSRQLGEAAKLCDLVGQALSSGEQQGIDPEGVCKN